MGEQLASLGAVNTVARSRLQRAAGFLITEVTGWAAGGSPLLLLTLALALTLALTLTRTLNPTLALTLAQPYP